MEVLDKGKESMTVDQVFEVLKLRASSKVDRTKVYLAFEKLLTGK